MKAIMKRAWEIFKTLTGDHIAKLAMALRQTWAEKKNGGKKMEGTEKQIKAAEYIKKEITSNLFLGSVAFTKKFNETVLESFNKAAWWLDNQAFLRSELLNARTAEQQAKAANKLFAEACEINPKLRNFRK